VLKKNGYVPQGQLGVPVLQTSPVCEACGTGMELRMWDRPGGPPGNGWGCPKCHPWTTPVEQKPLACDGSCAGNELGDCSHPETPAPQELTGPDVVVLYLDWGEGYDTQYACAVGEPTVAALEGTTRWRISLNIVTGEVTARRATVEEQGAHRQPTGDGT